MKFSEIKVAANTLILENQTNLGKYFSLAHELKGATDVPQYVRPVRAAFLSSYTIQGLPEVFAVKGAFHNLYVSTYTAPYNQFSQEILNPESGFNVCKPDLVYLLIDAADLLDEAHLDSILAPLTELRSNIIITNFIESPKAHTEKVAQLNRALEERVAEKIVSCFDLRHFISEQPSDVWYSKYVALGDLRIAPLAFPDLAEELLAHAVSHTGATRKCIVTDLDNTLWHGIVGEDGLENVMPNLSLQQWMLSRFEEGTILAINSRNNEADALEVFERHPNMLLKKDHFAAWAINWDTKDRNLVHLADELNIGIDSMLFIDDDPFQQNTVLQSLPEVAVLHPDHHARYRGFAKKTITDEDRRRGVMYLEERKRKEFKHEIGNEEDFLRKLNLHVIIRDITDAEKERVSQLTQKTNQYNLTTKRHSVEEIEALMQDGARIVTLSVTDVFGDYGITGVCIMKTEGEALVIDNFLMSCRILGRHIERTFLAEIVSYAAKQNLKRVRGFYIPTKKNAIARDFYAANGFTLECQRGDMEEWCYETHTPLQFPDYITVL